MNKAAEKEIKRIVAIIAKKHRPEKIYLFGSFAWGKPRRDSDVWDCQKGQKNCYERNKALKISQK